MSCVDVCIVTLDTDLLQLVEPGVEVFLYRPYVKGAPPVDYTVDAEATTVTFREPPPVDTLVAFRYRTDG